MYILFTLLGLVIGLATFYLFNKYKKPVVEENKEQKERLKKLNDDFTKVMTYSLEKSVRSKK
jgi:uncharacterized membrane-anchored protein YhcB (DUF1043 family)